MDNPVDSKESHETEEGVEDDVLAFGDFLSIAGVGDDDEAAVDKSKEDYDAADDVNHADDWVIDVGESGGAASWSNSAVVKGVTDVKSSERRDGGEKQGEGREDNKGDAHI